jgi:methionine-rich copper-binding protein CopC
MRLWILLLTTLLFISCGSNSSSNEQKNLTIDELNTHKTNTIPNIIINGDHTVTLTQGSPYNDEGATASDKEDGDISNKIVKVGNVNTQVAKTYTITYTITDSDGNVANANRSVIVKKRVGTTPIISLNGSSSVTIEKGTLYQDEGAISTDDEDGNITDKITLIVKQDRSENSKYILTYHIIDSDGNEASVNRILIVKDTKETTNNFPTIKLNGNSLITISIGTTYNEQGASASDIEDGDISNKITISGDVNTQEAGTYK